MARTLSGWIDETPWMPRLHTAEEDRAFCAGLLDRAEVWTVQDGAGFLALQGEDIVALYLATDIRGRGLGAALMDAVKQGRQRLSLWTFAANAGALRFYRREGFNEERRTDGAGNDERLPDIRLTWERTAP